MRASSRNGLDRNSPFLEHRPLFRPPLVASSTRSYITPRPSESIHTSQHHRPRSTSHIMIYAKFIFLIEDYRTSSSVGSFFFSVYVRPKSIDADGDCDEGYVRYVCSCG